MKKIKRIFIILTLTITLFTSSYERVDAIAIPMGISLKALITYGLVAIGGLVAIDYATEQTADNAQKMYDEYTDVMDKQLEEYAEETGRSDIYFNFKDNNYWRKNQPFVPDVDWNDDIKRLFKDFSNHIRSQFQAFPTEYSFFGNYGTINQYLDTNVTRNIQEIYEKFLNYKTGALFVFEDINIEDYDHKYIFIYCVGNDIEITYDNSLISINNVPSGKSLYRSNFGHTQSLNSAYIHSLNYDDYKMIDVWEYPDTNINSVIDLPDSRTIDELKEEGLLVGGNKDIMVENAEWVEDLKKKGKTIDDVDIMNLNGDMDSDGNYIPSNVLTVVPDDVWVDAIINKVPWDDLIQYPDVVIYDDDDAVVNTPDYPDDTKPDVYVPKNIDFGDNPELVRTDLKMIFPFCIPFDLIDAIKLFNAPPKAPVFEIPVPMGDLAQETVTIDLSSFEPVAQIFRICMTILFIISLILATRHLIKG